MPQIPTTQEITERNVTNIESSINQSSPLNDKAFIRVLSAMEAMNYTELYKFAVERALQNLAITATGDDLDLIGKNYDFPRKAAEAAQYTIELPALDGTLISQIRTFTGNDNGALYTIDADATAAGGVATINVTAEDTGVAGNLEIADEMTIDTPVPGAEDVAAITIILNTGAEEETDDAYRVRILDIIRTSGGGSNTADYRRWAQEVAGVARAYPYSGRPVDDPSAPPPARTVYIEADTTIDPDGLAPTSLLDEVRDTINIDPETGISRPALGTTDDTLFVQSIIRTGFYVEVRNLTVSASIEAQVKADISSALTTFFLLLDPFVDGLDPVSERNDNINDLKVSSVVNDVITAAGGSATGVGFGVVLAVFLSEYNLDPGEKAKLISVSYV